MRRLATALFVLTCGCVQPSGLVVQIASDLVPGVDVDSVRVDLMNLDGSRISSSDVALAAGHDLGRPRRVLSADLAAGRYALAVTLSRGGRVVVARPARVSVSGTTYTTLLMLRNCAGVTCPDTGDPNATACLGGRCTVPECSEEHPELCGTASCRTGADCPAAAVPCVTSNCSASGACWQAPDDTRCAAGELCDTRSGCVAVASLPDAGFSDAGVDASSAVDAASASDTGLDAPVLVDAFAAVDAFAPVDAFTPTDTGALADAPGTARDGGSTRTRACGASVFPTGIVSDCAFAMPTPLDLDGDGLSDGTDPTPSDCNPYVSLIDRSDIPGIWSDPMLAGCPWLDGNVTTVLANDLGLGDGVTIRADFVLGATPSGGAAGVTMSAGGATLWCTIGNFGGTLRHHLGTGPASGGSEVTPSFALTGATMHVQLSRSNATPSTVTCLVTDGNDATISTLNAIALGAGPVTIGFGVTLTSVTMDDVIVFRGP